MSRILGTTECTEGHGRTQCFAFFTTDEHRWAQILLILILDRKIDTSVAIATGTLACGIVTDRDLAARRNSRESSLLTRDS